MALLRLLVVVVLASGRIVTADAQSEKGPKVNAAEYEGWRQYSVQCARCHGQDVLGNPVAANLLTSLGPGGPIDTPEKFSQVVSEGRIHRGMPAFKQIMSPEQIQSVYAYVKGRADKRISPGRPIKPPA
jgi:mono/diheme cytochrome c family protein